MRYNVNINNIGTVHTGSNRRAALAVAKDYANNVAQGEGRGEFPVTVFCDGEPLAEYIGATVQLVGLTHDGEGWSVNDVYRASDIALPIDATPRQTLRAVRDALGLSGERMVPLWDGFWRLAGSTLAVTLSFDY